MKFMSITLVAVLLLLVGAALTEVVVGKKAPDTTYVDPMSTEHFPVAGVGGGSVVWKIIIDFGAIGLPHSSLF